MVFLTMTESLGVHDDLMFLVDGCDAVIPLNRSFRCRHLRRFIVGDVAFHFLWLLTLPHPWGLRL